MLSGVVEGDTGLCSDTGKDEGNEVRIKVDLKEGLVVGDTGCSDVGIIDGDFDGNDDCAKVGAKVIIEGELGLSDDVKGNDIGTDDNKIIGSVEGDDDGDVVNKDVGAAVGVMIGEDDGAIIGDNDDGGGETDFTGADVGKRKDKVGPTVL